MKTKQEQIEKLAQLIGRIKDDCENCDCKSCEVNGEDCCCVHYICATFLVEAGYGDVSEYKAEIERLEQQNAIQCDAWQKLSDENERLVTENNSNLRHNSVLRKENKKLKEEIKQAQIDVLNKVKERAVGLAAIETYHICNLIDEFIKEVENEQKD